MGSYLIRRLLIMIPTLFGITVVSFCIMQLAPGDPVLNQLNSGNAGQSSETADAFAQRKRDLHLDKPLVLNFNQFRDFSIKMRVGAFYLSRKDEAIQADLTRLAGSEKNGTAVKLSKSEADDSPSGKERLAFLKKLDIPDFGERLRDPEQRPRLAKAVEHYTEEYCSNVGSAGVPAAMEILRDPRSDKQMQIGAIRALVKMVSDPFSFTYSVKPSDAETEPIVAAWRIWWDRKQTDFPSLDTEASKYLDEKMAEMVGDKKDVQPALDAIDNDNYTDVATRYFAQKLLAADSSLAQRDAAAYFLKQHYNEPLKMDVPLGASAADVKEVAANWLEHYKLHLQQYEPVFLQKIWDIAADTQYAYLVARLATFHFGNSALRTREPVSEKIWNAMLVSAPLMLMSQVFIYLVAVPLGIVCGIYRGKALDQGISLSLFILYSIPGFIAAMLCLVFFCYGDYLKIFPMLGLHSENAARLAWWPYLLDYAWHAFLPVVCLSLFTLAALAMYSRSSMLDVLNQDYIRTARAKGLPGSSVIFKHGLRNALIPILTLFSNFLPAMLGGSVLIESIFDIPGMGRLGWISIEQKDFPTLMALLYIEAIVVLISYLITDVLYVIVDPRINFSGRGNAA